LDEVFLEAGSKKRSMRVQFPGGTCRILKKKGLIQRASGGKEKKSKVKIAKKKKGA